MLLFKILITLAVVSFLLAGTGHAFADPRPRVENWGDYLEAFAGLATILFTVFALLTGVWVFI